MRVKICGLSTPETVDAAVTAGAGYVGFVLFPPSPRAVSPELLAELAVNVPAPVCKVALTVDPDDALIDCMATLPLDMVQLHGHEQPERVREIRSRLGLPVMKAIGVREASDLPAIATYAEVADQLLIDAKPPKSAVIPGGNGLSFDWRLIAGRRWNVPWMLAGGLKPETVPDAVALTGAAQLDVSSGVESAPGTKDPALIAAFLEAARSV